SAGRLGKLQSIIGPCPEGAAQERAERKSWIVRENRTPRPPAAYHGLVSLRSSLSESGFGRLHRSVLQGHTAPRLLLLSPTFRAGTYGHFRWTPRKQTAGVQGPD